MTKSILAITILALTTSGALAAHHRQRAVSALNRNRVMPPHSIRFDHIIFECDAFGVIFLEPSVRSFFVRKNFEMAGVANTVSGVDIDPNGRHWFLLSFRFPQCISL